MCTMCIPVDPLLSPCVPQAAPKVRAVETRCQLRRWTCRRVMASSFASAWESECRSPSASEARRPGGQNPELRAHRSLLAARGRVSRPQAAPRPDARHRGPRPSWRATAARPGGVRVGARRADGSGRPAQLIWSDRLSNRTRHPGGGLGDLAVRAHWTHGVANDGGRPAEAHPLGRALACSNAVERWCRLVKARM